MDIDTINYLADLARLDIPEAEKAGLVTDLESIIGFIDRIQKVDIGAAGVQSGRDVNVFRDDVVEVLVPTYDLIEAAPDHQDHFVKVPKVLE